MFDFGALPPEINSGRMYTGPGSGPIMAAASAWDAVAAEMGTAASAYNSVINEAKRRGIDNRTAAQVLAIDRVAQALMIRGIYP